MSTVMVTGGMGFVGLRTACALAQRGDRVVVFDPKCRASQIEQRDVGWGGARIGNSRDAGWLPPLARHLAGPLADKMVFVHGDCLNVSEVMETIRLYGVEKIVHCAALFDPLLEFEHPYEAFQANTGTAVAVFDAARVLKLGRVIFLSSIAAYGVRQHELIDEAHLTHSIVTGNPSGPHGAVKVAAEAIGMTYFSAYGLDFVALRLSAAFGVGMQLPVHIRPMVESAVRGLTCAFDQGEMSRDYLYVEEMVRGILCALDAEPGRLKQRIFNLGAGAITTTQELADVVRSVIPGARITVGGGMSDLESSNFRMRGRLDVSAAREQLGFSPALDLRAGIAAYAEELRRMGPS